MTRLLTPYLALTEITFGGGIAQGQGEIQSGRPPAPFSLADLLHRIAETSENPLKPPLEIQYFYSKKILAVLSL